MTKYGIDESQLTPLQDMKIGGSGYIVPWGMFIDNDKSLQLNSNYEFIKESIGTFELEVMRTSKGFVVNIAKCKDFPWVKGWHYVGQEYSPLPVSRLIGGVI